MRRLLSHLATCALLVGLLVTAGLREAKADVVIGNSVTITDDTTGETTTFSKILATASNQSGEIRVPSGLDTSATGFALGLLGASSNGSMMSWVAIGGVGTVLGTSTDSYTVTIQTSATGFESFPVWPWSLNTYWSATVSNTTSATIQDSTGYHSSLNELNDTTGRSTDTGAVTISATGLGNSATAFAAGTTYYPDPLVSPYALTNVLTFTIVGNGQATNSSERFYSTTFVNPEPGTFVMFLAVMPIPLVVLYLQRRRGPLSR